MSKLPLFANRRYYEATPTLKASLFILAVAFVLAFLIYTQGVIRNLRKEAERVSQIFANLYAMAATARVVEGIELNIITEEVIQKTEFPMIITDVKGKPQAWKGVGLSYADTTKPSTYRILRKMVKEMDRKNRPIPLESERFGIFGYLHYGDSVLMHRLRWLPLVEISTIFLFVLLGFLGFRYIKNSEQRYIWIGMAKEAAHQLGTPLSSLGGWIELVKSKVSGKEERGDNSLEGIVGEMQRDLCRLNKVASRFSQIGSSPELKRQNPVPVISETVSYFKKRLPQLGSKVQIGQDYQPVPDIPLNRELLGWAFENLLKNALDAIDKTDGRILISVGMYPDGRHVLIDFSDNGRGLSNKQLQRIFLPGYTTKKRGWGLGLTFVKRIIEEYHNGKVFVEKSRPGEGTTIRILLPSI